MAGTIPYSKWTLQAACAEWEDVRSSNSLVYPEKELAFSKHTLLTPSLPQKVTYHHTFTRDDLASQPVNV